MSSLFFIGHGVENLVSLQRVSLIRPAPAEFPQVRKEARVGG